MKEKPIDEIFKHRLGDPAEEAGFREGDWDNFEQMLDKGKRNKKVFWLPVLSSVAAVLLAFFGWWLFKPAATAPAKTQQVTVNKTMKTQQQTSVNPTQKTGNIDQQEKTIAVAKATIPTQQNKAQHPYLASPKNTGSYNTQGEFLSPGKVKPTGGVFTARNNNANPQNLTDTARAYNVIAATGPVLNISPLNDAGMPVIASVTILPKADNRSLTAGTKSVIKKAGGSSFRPQFAISVLASSEVNGAGSLQSASSGTNIGLMFSAGVKKFSISTGLNYSAKPYTLAFDQYHTNVQFNNTPQNVNADCRVLDIPINIGYQVYNRSSNKITVGTGLSSYIMMHESYNYTYSTPAAALSGPASYAVKGQGKYYFSIMNLQASYERRINSKVGLSLQPYLKIPLSEIGYSQAKLETFGVAVGLNWNLNSITKPK